MSLLTDLNKEIVLLHTGRIDCKYKNKTNLENAVLI